MTALIIIYTYFMVLAICTAIGETIRQSRIEKKRNRTTEILRDIYSQSHPD